MNSLPQPGNLAQQKADLRRKIKALLQSITPEERALASRALVGQLRSQPAWVEARAVLFYAAIALELDLAPLLDEAERAGKTLLFPRFVAASGAYEAAKVSNRASDLQAARYGILEPCAHCPAYSLSRTDFILVPGVAFDLKVARVGRGAGYYDRLLAEIPALKCGVCFDNQLERAIPTEPHDVKMDYIVTPTMFRKTQ